MYKCPDIECTSCGDFNQSANRGNCNTCLSNYEVVDTRCVLRCGDGAFDSGEECDEGNMVSGDGCSSSCLIESGWVCVGYGVNTCY